MYAFAPPAAAIAASEPASKRSSLSIAVPLSWVVRAWRARRVLGQFSALSDRDLADFGLVRGDAWRL
ncbi:MAG: DUF1127 domain-containing protein [Hyphomicrobiales bacterium]|nr:DUF1127 domain-containing protein [Hyphomicrobiales bacterium]